ARTSVQSRASAGGAPAPRPPAARTSVQSRASAGGAPAPRPPAARTSVQSRASAGGAPAPRRPAARTSSTAASTSAKPRGEALDRDVLVRPREIPALLVRGVPRPAGIVQVAASEHAEVG